MSLLQTPHEIFKIYAGPLTGSCDVISYFLATFLIDCNLLEDIF
jgi:hypothetical protein